MIRSIENYVARLERNIDKSQKMYIENIQGFVIEYVYSTKNPIYFDIESDEEEWRKERWQV